MDYIDDMVGDLEEREKRSDSGSASRNEDFGTLEAGKEHEESGTGSIEVKRKVLVGIVDHFYDRINVAAIQLTGGIKIGDTIEIEGADELIRLRVSSMQINKEEVEAASEGDDVGIKTDVRVSRGSKVYVVE